MKTKAGNRRRAKGVAVLFLILCAAVLILLRCTVSNASANENAPEPRYKYYTSIQIQTGDTLWSIAENYMTGEYADIYEYINEVMEINHLNSDFLQAGKRLCVPYYSSEYKE